MNKNKFTNSAAPDVPASINTPPETHYSVNADHSNNHYSDLQIIRSINGKPVTQNELISNHIISEGGAMKIILTARRRAMEETQFDGSQKFTN